MGRADTIRILRVVPPAACQDREAWVRVALVWGVAQEVQLKLADLVVCMLLEPQWEEMPLGSLEVVDLEVPQGSEEAHRVTDLKINSKEVNLRSTLAT